jgi:A nuclease family of the HNH/ENDO VII superfamily with conserved AHH
MSRKRYFDDLQIPADSPLCKCLGIKSGNYSGQYDAKHGQFLLKKRGGNQGYSMSITPDQLIAVFMMLRRDKFTSEELAIIEKIKRSSGFSGSKAFPAHHLIPIDVCKNSKLVVQAIRFGIFSENDNINRLPLPAYFHNEGGHKKYSNFVAGILEDEWATLVSDKQENDEVSVRLILEGIISYCRDIIQDNLNSGSASIEHVFPMWD